MILPIVYDNKTSIIEKAVLTALIAVSIIPDIGLKIQIAGFTWTAYRTVVPASLIIVLLLDGFHIRLDDKKSVNNWLLLLAVWIIYGLALIIGSGYADLHDGFIELLSVFNGIIVIYCLGRLIKSTDDLNFCIRIVAIVLTIVAIFAFFEILTGHHWVMSAYNDHNSSISGYTNRHMATGFMYNMNDFSAMITCLVPVLIIEKSWLRNIWLLIFIVIINVINDATTCNLAIIIAFGFFCFFLRNPFHKGTMGKKAVSITLSVCIMFCIFTAGLSNFVSGNGIVGAVSRQIANFQNHTGSLYVRYNVYIESIRAWINSCFIGIGPAGFTNYFISNVKNARIVNPHSFLLEILTEYGLLIFVGFIINLWQLFRKAYFDYSKDRSKEFDLWNLMIMVQIIVYLIISFAPSSFIGYSYQWLTIALLSNMSDPSCLEKEQGTAVAFS